MNTDESSGYGEALDGCSVLVTGASGFIGMRLSRALLGRRARVYGAAREPRPWADSDVEWHYGDLRSEAFVEALFERSKPDTVFHLSSYVSGSRDLNAVLPMLTHNLLAAVHVLREATKNRCRRVILAGSMEEPDPRDHSPCPASPYAAAKWAATAYGAMFRALYGTVVVTARIFMVYGPGQWDSKKLVPYVITSLANGDAPEVSSGVRPVDWVHVDDVVAGLLRLATIESPPADPVDLGSGELVTVREIVEQIERLMGQEGKTRFGAIEDRQFERVRRADTRGAFESIGWTPRISLEAGLKDTIRWFTSPET